ncbi:hypothetical protein TNCV_2064211 [Trichonephila clavipes]|nr:hypothetical protein TNCV_2064211 [Trichonephila clavipes]
MLTIFWDASGMRCMEFLTKEFTVNSVRSLRLRGLSPESGLLKENSRKRTKCRPSKTRCSNTFVTAMEEPIDLPRSAWGRPSNGLKRLFGDRQNWAEEQPKCRAQRSGESKPGKNFRTLQEKFPPNQENRCVEIVCFHCGRPECNALPREKGFFDKNRRRTLTTLALKKKYADQTLSPFYAKSTKADPHVVTDPRRHIADPVSRQAVGARKTRRATFQGERECLAIVWATNKFRPYIFTIIPKVLAFKGSYQMGPPTQEHDFDVKYKTGKKHNDADALSKIQYTEYPMEQKKDQDLAKLKL